MLYIVELISSHHTACKWVWSRWEPKPL